MPNFKIIFMKHFEDDDEDLDTGEYSRVIVADNLEIAQKIADAMQGEEVYVNEWLEKILSVKPTDETPNIYSWDDGSHTWKQVLRQLNLREDDVEFILSGSQKIGIKIKEGKK